MSSTAACFYLIDLLLKLVLVSGWCCMLLSGLVSDLLLKLVLLSGLVSDLLLRLVLVDPFLAVGEMVTFQEFIDHDHWL